MRSFRIWYQVHAIVTSTGGSAPVTDVLHIEVNAEDQTAAADIAYRKIMKHFRDRPGQVYYDLEFGEIKEIFGVLSPRYYVAYGSNINVSQMEHRCPTAEIVGTGWIDNHYLAFGGRTERAVATVKPRKGSKVPVLVWTVDESDELSLDRYEGFPHFYRKEMIPVRMDDGRNLDCMVYLLNPRIRGIPSEFYVDIIREGYQDVGLDEAYLDKAIKNACRNSA